MTEVVQRKVLVVEDDPDAAETVAIVLESEGYAVTRAQSAEEGLREVEAQRPDVIVLDIMMPSGTEGFHFVWSLRKNADERLREIPIIVLTAIHEKTRVRFYPDIEDPEYKPGEYLPVQAFLDKPATSEQLIGKIEEVLADAGSSAGSRQGGAAG